MMGRIDNQMQLLILDLDSMIPENHLLRQIKNSVNFDFIYEKASSFYSHTGRKSIDPVVMIKMLLIGYLYGIKSERRLEEEVSLNLAYRWFCEPRPVIIILPLKVNILYIRYRRIFIIYIIIIPSFIL